MTGIMPINYTEITVSNKMLKSPKPSLGTSSMIQEVLGGMLSIMGASRGE